jgi:hypothetical protein
MQTLKRFFNHTLCAAALVLTSASALAAPVPLDVRVNTQDLNGTAGALDFQLNPAVVGAPDATVTITLFSEVSRLSGTPLVDGAVTGDLATTLTLSNTSSFNAYLTDYLFSKEFTFRIAFSGTFFDTMSSDQSLFTLNLLDASFAPIVPSATVAHNLAVSFGENLLEVIPDLTTVPGQTLPRVQIFPVTDNPAPTPMIPALLLVGGLAFARLRRPR